MRFAYLNSFTLTTIIFISMAGLYLFFRYVRKERETVLARFGNTRLIEKMTSAISMSRRRTKNLLSALALLLLIIVLARPQMGSSLIEMKRKGVDIIFAIDTSTSMLAQDLKPNRLEVAKGEIGNFIDLLQGDRVGLVAFAGTAFVQCPLTLDYQAAKMFLDVIDTDIIPVKGTAIGDAIRKANLAFNVREKKHKVLILLTDGGDHDTKPVEAAKEAAENGVVIYTIGLGSTSGEPIPVYDKYGSKIGYKKDKKGEIVLSKLDAVTLQRIALETGGKFYQAISGSLELEKIYEEISQLEQKELSSELFTTYEDRYQYLLILVILLLLVEYLLSDSSVRQKTWEGRFE